MRAYLAFFSTTNDSTQRVSILTATSGIVALSNVWNLGTLEFVLTQLQRSELLVDRQDLHSVGNTHVNCIWEKS